MLQNNMILHTKLSAKQMKLLQGGAFGGGCDTYGICFTRNDCKVYPAGCYPTQLIYCADGVCTFYP